MTQPSLDPEDAPNMLVDGFDTEPDPPRWMLGGEPPEPVVFEDAKPADPDKAEPSNTTTGTDPLGRAIGPAEDHTVIKKVRDEDGKVVTPKRDGTLPESASEKRRKAAVARRG